MAKMFPRGEPQTPEGKALNKVTHALITRDHQDLDSMFPGGWDTFDLESGEVELVAGEETFRCYPGPIDEDYTALIIDDYHPDADANLVVDEDGIVQNPEDDDG